MLWRCWKAGCFRSRDRSMLQACQHVSATIWSNTIQHWTSEHGPHHRWGSNPATAILHPSPGVMRAVNEDPSTALPSKWRLLLVLHLKNCNSDDGVCLGNSRQGWRPMGWRIFFSRCVFCHWNHTRVRQCMTGLCITVLYYVWSTL